MRVFSISDIHIDFTENARWIKDISEKKFKQDALIFAGDAAHNLKMLQDVLLQLKAKFKEVFFVPGNHDLWIHNSDWGDSLEKFEALRVWCIQQEIQIAPRRLGLDDKYPVQIIPLFSWYSGPENGSDSLYVEKPGEDSENRMWSDNYYIRWPQQIKDFDAASYFASLNEKALIEKSQLPVISFSHFLPRREMMFGETLKPDPEKIKKYDRHPEFNFSRVAGSGLIEKQIRELNSVIHIYGHQHINRDRVLDGIRYVAHCLGYPNERERDMVKGIEQGLKLIWDTDSGMCP